MAGGDIQQRLTRDLPTPKFQAWALDRTVWGHPWVSGAAQSLGDSEGRERRALSWPQEPPGVSFLPVIQNLVPSLPRLGFLHMSTRGGF